jgi:hypothetical protein
MRWGKRDEIGPVGRQGVSLLGLFLLGGLWSEDAFGVVLGVIGVVVLAASTGVVELAIAVWYRQRRRHGTKRAISA